MVLLSQYSTAEAAKKLGVHRDTLLRWLRTEKCAEPARDHRGWRTFSSDNIELISSQIISESEPPKYRNRKISNLKNIGWDFSDAKTDYLTHSLHPYPAKFIPQIPNALIQELSSVGDTILDIFAGSGTTLVEALTLKRNAIGIDANPLSLLICKAKTTILTQREITELNELAQKAAEVAHSKQLVFSDLFSKSSSKASVHPPEHSAIEFWFEPFIAKELAEILAMCNALHTEDCRTLAKIAFSACVVSVSTQDSDTRYVRKEKNLHSGAAFGKFSKTLSKSVKAITEFSDVVEPRFNCEIIHENILEKPRIAPVDLLVCSPPYPNAYSYHLYHMTRMVWLGFDQIKFKKEEIGSHRKYSSNGKNAATIKTFDKEMSNIFHWLRDIVKPRKYASLVVGNSRIKGKDYDNSEIIKKIAKNNRFIFCEAIKRDIKSTKKSFNPKIGKIKTENILIFQNRSQ